MEIAAFIIALFVTAEAAWAASASRLPADCVVQLDSGAVRGYVRRAEDNIPYVSFRGIPYVTQPVGRRRFAPPEPAVPWRGVLDARREGPACPQRDIFYRGLMTPRGAHEACLHLNVHVPHRHLPAPVPPRHNTSELPLPRAPFPVLVYIHGGGFGFGSGDSDLYGPEYLVTKGVIVVTFNYRLGALGFLSLNSAELPGNLGLRDIVETLRWVRRNIAGFGGDPDNVTIAGQSAGAAAAHLLTFSPMSAGLFTRAILMSGVATRSWFSTSPANSKRLAETFLEQLNITTREPRAVIDALRQVSVDRIVQVTSVMQDTEGLNTFVPVVESKFDDVEPFLDEDPYKLLTDGRFLDVPLIIGHTDKECYSYARRFREIDFMKTLGDLPIALVPPSLIFVSMPQQLPGYVADIQRRYFSGAITEDSFEEFLDYCTDSYFVYPALKLAEVLSKHASSPIYLYEFAYSGVYSPVKEEISGIEFSGAGHVEDMTYLLKTNSYKSDIAAGSLDEWVKDWMTVMFSNYMKTSDPTPEEPDGIDNFEWPQMSWDSQFSLLVNTTLSIQQHRHFELLSFFDELHDTALSVDQQSQNPVDTDGTAQHEDDTAPFDDQQSQNQVDTDGTAQHEDNTETDKVRPTADAVTENLTEESGGHEGIVLPSNHLLPPKD